MKKIPEEEEQTLGCAIPGAPAAAQPSVQLQRIRAQTRSPGDCDAGFSRFAGTEVTKCNSWK